MRSQSNLLLITESGWFRKCGAAIALAGVAAFLGWSVAKERWLLLVATAAVPILALWPVPVALGTFAFLIPFDSVGVIGQEKGGAALTFFAGGLAGAVLFLIGYLRRRLELPKVAALWWFLFVTWAGISSLWSMNASRGIAFLPTAIATLVLYVVATSVRITPQEFSWVVLAVILGGCAAGLYSSHEYYSGVFYHSAASIGRGTLSIGENETDPNVFAASLFLPLSLAIARFLETRSWRRLLYAGMGTLTLLAIVLTMSRGALLGVAVMIFVYFRRLGLNRRVIIPVSVVLLSLVALPDKFMGRVETAESSGGTGRLYIWQTGLAALKDHGLIGVGLGNFGEAYTRYLGASSQIYSYKMADAHNDYLLVAVELGIVGLGLMVMAIVSEMRAGRRLQSWINSQGLRGLTVPYEAAACAMLTSCFFVGMLWRKAFWLVWIMYAMALRLASEKRSESKAGETVASKRDDWLLRDAVHQKIDFGRSRRFPNTLRAGFDTGQLIRPTRNIHQ